MKKNLRKISALLLVGIMCCSFTSWVNPNSASASTTKQVSKFSDMPVKTVQVSAKDPDYRAALYEVELYNYKLIMNVPTAYEAKSWEAYCSVANLLKKYDPKSISDDQFTHIKSIVKARKELIQIASAKECMLYIWGKDMPSNEDTSTLEFTVASQDNSDFKPFLVPYLLKNQKKVKGNIIVIAGGGYSMRNNAMEGWPIAKAFNKLGYNAFVLQRRVEPYSPEDIWMDMQRTVRYIRYNAKNMGLGGTDCITAAGFSGGGMTIIGEIDKLYGDIQPTIYDKTYESDEVDTVSADLDAACIIYGAFPEDLSSTKNPNIPPLFLAAGADDIGTAAGNDGIYKTLYGKVMIEKHTFANVGHGFGTGIKGTTSTYWIAMADNFITQVIEKAKNKNVIIAPKGDIPKEYTKSQTFEVELGFGKTVVTCAVNDGETKFYAIFTAFGSIQAVGGTVKDGVVTVTIDPSGYMAGDAQTIWNATDNNAWKNIK